MSQEDECTFTREDLLVIEKIRRDTEALRRHGILPKIVGKELAREIGEDAQIYIGQINREKVTDPDSVIVVIHDLNRQNRRGEGLIVSGYVITNNRMVPGSDELLRHTELNRLRRLAKGFGVPDYGIGAVTKARRLKPPKNI
jgi:hypothetical protein